MDDQRKQEINARHERAKEHGVKFYPDIVYKDMIVAFGVFVLLLALATFVGVKAEPPADPNDSAYIPRPEWYFLFLFQLLKYFPGKVEWIGTTILPAAAVLALLFLPFYDRSPFRNWHRRRLALAIMGAAMLGIVALTVVAAVTTPPQEEAAILTSVTDQIAAGQDLYSVNCVECHGEDGEGGEIKGVEGLEGFKMKPLHSDEYMFTRDDKTLASVIEYGQPERGMPPFGKAYGGELSTTDVNTIVTFMRYSWDSRIEMPKEAAAAGTVPTLGPNEIPSYTANIQPIVRRACLSCHRPGKKNNNYLMTTYQEIMTSGDDAPNVVPGDPNSLLLRLIRREQIKDFNPMPPSKALKPEWVAIFERWVAAGALETPPPPGTTLQPIGTPSPGTAAVSGTPVPGTTSAVATTPALTPTPSPTRTATPSPTP